ncbi:SBBP repeat-containing protein [uncultured Nevskia sp.]|uniref:DUF7948 domain-containing protein n=1 Tax=uncultured Nevskia sp. TaxID=228950 RepID=UPI0025FAC114|nr:SBBP repeat-containing protein [uncultured Nevskia sp.]
MSFEPNVGQSAAAVKYLARGPGYSLGLVEDGAVLSLHSIAKPAQSSVSKRQADSDSRALQLHLVGTSAGAKLQAELPQASYSNYLAGTDPAKWHTHVANYDRVRYSAVYPGIDWLVYGNPQQLEYDFVVAPEADPRTIRLNINGADSLTLDDHGDLLIKVGDRVIRQQKPVVYQTVAGERKHVDAGYELKGQQLAFNVAAYDHSQPLTIDPVLAYSTYLGSNGFEGAYAVAVDANGNILFAGETESAHFPVTNALQSHFGGAFECCDGFIAKLSADGSQKLFATYIGGHGDDIVQALAVDAAGDVYVAGYTSSTDFPTFNPLQAHNAASDGQASAFVSKLKSDGSAFLYSTYLGGDTSLGGGTYGNDIAYAIAVDGAGNAYVAGETDSSNFPVRNAFQAVRAGPISAFVSKINPAGSALVYSTYLGGSNEDDAFAIAVDSAGNAYVAGKTDSNDFPTVNPLQAYAGGSDAFVVKFTADGSALSYGTYFGGTKDDEVKAIAVDAAGNAYIAGSTRSANLKLRNPLQPHSAGGQDGFVGKIKADGSALVYASYLGGSADDSANAIAVDSAGDAYVAGSTFSTNFPTARPLQAANAGGRDAFVSKLSPDGSSLLYSTYLGGTVHDVVNGIAGDDQALAIAVDAAGTAYVAGSTSSTDFPTVNPVQAANGSGPCFEDSDTNCVTDAFVAKITDSTVVGSSGPVQFSKPLFTTQASSGNAVITVTRKAPYDGPASVRYSAAAASSKTGSDFTQVSGTLSWAPGEKTAKTFSVPLLPASENLPIEFVRLGLSKPAAGTTLGTLNKAALAIQE